MSAAKKKKKAAPAKNMLPFLVEIGTEELPPKSLKKLAHAFLDNFETLALAENLLPAGTHNEVYFSPRRLAVYAPALRLKQPDRHEERLGPAVSAAFDAQGKPTKAAEGFANSCGVPVEKLEHRKTEKGERLACAIHIPGEAAQDILPDLIREALAKLPIGKRMRWGTGEAEFVRPVHWVLMLLGDKPLKGGVLGVTAGKKTYGHRFHHPAAIVLKHPEEYRKTLEKTGKVLVEDREGSLVKLIATRVTQLAKKVDGEPILEQVLLEEVAALVEWPVPILGNFDEKFKTLPEEVIKAVLQGQQRYFPIRAGTGGELLPYFVTVSNIESRDPKEVQHGNERVIVPRLTDAMFFWDLDKGTRLDAHIEDLELMVFQKELGSYGNKQKRVGALAEDIARRVGSNPEMARRAAALAKCDLLSNLVGEFPELQGSIGMHIARLNDEPLEVARAIEEHYRPRFALDELPDTKTGQVLAVADKLDTVAGIFAIGQKPTGEKDPFGLRRAGLGLMRILVREKLDLDIVELIRIALAAQPVQGKAAEPLVTEVYEFLLERLRAYYLEQGIRADVFEAVRAKQPHRPLDFQRRVQAVNAFLDLPEAAALAAANKRIANILRQAGTRSAVLVEAGLLKETAEQALHSRIETLRAEVEPLVQAGDYSAALKKLAALRGPVDAFFDKVLVMDPDAAVKANRLALLASLSALFLHTADLALIQVD